MTGLSIADLPMTMDPNTFPGSIPVLRPASNHSCDITVLSTMPGDYGLPDPRPDSSSGTITPAIPQNDGRLLDPPQVGNPEDRWIYGWIARVAWNIFRTAINQLHVL